MIACCCAGCDSPGKIPGTNDRILEADSIAARRQIRKFRITPDEAQRLADNYARHDGFGGAGYLQFIIGDDYQFAGPDSLEVRDLSGEYVNGYTGTVVWKEIPYAVYGSFFWYGIINQPRNSEIPNWPPTDKPSTRPTDSPGL